MNLITLSQLLPMEVYLDYLSLKYAIRLHFLPQHHALGPPQALTETHPNLPGLHRLYSLSKHLVQGKLENRTTTSTADGTNMLPSPNPDKTITPQQLHEEWLHTLPNHTVAVYTDGSKLENGSVRCGWAAFHCGDQRLYWLGEGSCHLGNRAEVYNAKLHTIQEAVTSLLTTTAPRATAIICVDNRMALKTLQFNKHNHEYARCALEMISDLSLLGWEISTTWCPSHCNINGNERADTLAKWGASYGVPCRFTLTAKTRLLAQARGELLQRWKTELPLSKPSFKFPSHLHRVNWADTQAIWRVFCNRSPSDPPPNIKADPCPYGTDLTSSHHLLRDCPLLMPQRALLHKATTGDIQSLEFITAPENSNPLRHFLPATVLGHSALIRFDGSHKTPDCTNASDSASPKPDFGAFEP